MAEASFGRYRVTGTLGSGAMGDVYEAVDEVLGREVAVKTLKGGATGLAARMLDERFRLEARAIATLAHPNVVQVFDIDLAAEPPYLVMERVAGPSLKEQLEQGPLSNSQLRALGIQIANALTAAHAAKIMHRDVKPANILAAGASRWKLADFGVAHVPDSSLTMTGQFVGSPAYAPPEALVRGQTGPEGDVFGLGATLYQAALGRWPRAEATTGGLLAPVAALRSLAPHVSEEIASAIDRAVAIEPTDRPSAAELAELLASGTSRPSMPAAVPIPSTPLPRQISGGIATELVADESRPGVAALATMSVAAPPRRRVPWKPIAIGAAIVGVILVIAAVESDSKAKGGIGNTLSQPAASALPAAAPRPDPDAPHRIQVAPPRTDDPDAQAHWNAIAARVNGGDFASARDLLEDWEEAYGETAETRSLASQLDALPKEALQRVDHPGRGRGKKKKFKD